MCVFSASSISHPKGFNRGPLPELPDVFLLILLVNYFLNSHKDPAPGGVTVWPWTLSWPPAGLNEGPRTQRWYGHQSSWEAAPDLWHLTSDLLWWMEEWSVYCPHSCSHQADSRPLIRCYVIWSELLLCLLSKKVKCRCFTSRKENFNLWKKLPFSVFTLLLFLKLN